MVHKVKIVQAREESTHEIAGVPPRTQELVELVALQKDHAPKVRAKAKNGLKERFEAHHVGGGEMTEARAHGMTAEGCRKSAEDHLVERIGRKLDSLATAVGGARLGFPNKQPQRERET